MNRPIRIATLCIVILGLMAATVGRSVAQDLGITPSHVYGMWRNVNDALLAVARVVSDDAAWRASLAEMPVRAVTEKRPAEVLGQVAVFRDQLDRLRRAAGMDAVQRAEDYGGEITPTVVFLNSGQMLNGVVDWLLKYDDPQLLLSQYYRRPRISGKTPGDVFTLVDLANRRIHLILEKQPNGPPKAPSGLSLEQGSPSRP